MKYKILKHTTTMVPVETIEEFEYRLVDRTSIASLNIEVPIDEAGEKDEWEEN